MSGASTKRAARARCADSSAPPALATLRSLSDLAGWLEEHPDDVQQYCRSAASRAPALGAGSARSCPRAQRVAASHLCACTRETRALSHSRRSSTRRRAKWSGGVLKSASRARQRPRRLVRCHRRTARPDRRHPDGWRARRRRFAIQSRGRRARPSSDSWSGGARCARRVAVGEH